MGNNVITIIIGVMFYLIGDAMCKASVPSERRNHKPVEADYTVKEYDGTVFTNLTGKLERRNK